MKIRRWVVSMLGWVGMFVLAGALCLGSDEINVNLGLSVDNGSFSLSRSLSNHKITQTNSAADLGIQTVTVGSTNNLSIWNVSTPGYAWFQNLNATNSIYMTVTIKLGPGDGAVLRLASTNIPTYCIAGTNKIEYWVNQE